MSKREKLPFVVICTDGSCEPNPGEASWGVVLTWPDSGQTQEAGGYIGHATNNIAELTAAIESLKLLSQPHRVTLNSDSQWLINCATGYWRRHTHHELWSQLDELAQLHKIHWHWVRGHAGDACNERAHELAEQYRRSAQPSKVPHWG